MRVCHVINSLETGGAERMLVRLLERHASDQCVISVADDGPQGEAIRALGVPVYVLRRKVWRLWRRQQYRKPEVVVGWLYHGNLVASLLGKRWRVPVVWNVRHSVDDLRQEKAALRWVIRAGAWASSTPRRIVFNSTVAAAQHRALGYCGANIEVLPNGIDTRVFSPRPDARRELCQSLGLSQRSFVIGHLARFHPMKDHRGFLQAAALVARKSPDAQFIMAGRGVEEGNVELELAIEKLKLGGRVRMLGERRDVESLLPGLDLFVLSSAWGEGFPNALLEAMACGLPVVTTDVGDARSMVGEAGRVVLPGNPAALANAINEVHELGSDEQRKLGRAARRRVVEAFEIDRVAQRYHSTWTTA